MVCLGVTGGGLSAALEQSLVEAYQTFSSGNFGAAAAQYHEILGLSPHHPDALHMLGLIAQRAEKPELALSLIEDALASRPLFPLARFNRGVVLRLLGRDMEAMMSAQMALDTDPDLAAAWDLIGQIHKDRGEVKDAEECFVRAIRLQGNNAHFYGNYALLLFGQGNIGAAYQAAQRAELLDPNYPPTLLGNIFLTLGYPELAADRFAKARVLRPKFRDGAASEAMARLQMGDWSEGWALWERRPDLVADKNADLAALRLWDGERVDHLLLYEDQGLGDALMFLRYLPLIRDRATRVTLRLARSLLALARDTFPDLHIIGEEDAVPAANARSRLASLPFFFDTKLTNVPSTPYLSSSVEKRSKWREKLKANARPRIGLAWAGNPKFRNDRKRSIPFDALAPLRELQAKYFVTLQQNHTDPTGFGLDAGPLLRDFADTAALIAELDLVITVDTAVAHLAGALDKPVWVLLPFSSDWRWLLGREDSPWYKRARLFRQKAEGDWEPVLKAVAKELEQFLAGDRKVLTASIWTGTCLRQNPDALPLAL